MHDEGTNKVITVSARHCSEEFINHEHVFSVLGFSDAGCLLMFTFLDMLLHQFYDTSLPLVR